ncbi:glycine receptor subunit alpha-2-like [Lingula anatina]|nr:glycine receptor subunit alpha-2-like [Lingula anatina]|eukprot:XP_013401407.1 glycine receptor subunit alpha-2-like [Lingula anatina]
MQHRLPRVSYIKAVDVWLTTCLIFVVTSMLEYAVANMLLQRTARQKEKAARPEPNSNILKAFQSSACEKNVNGVPTAILGAEIIPLTSKKHHVDMPTLDFTPLESKWNADNLDRASRVIFTSAFAIFNAVYWCAYLLN